MKAKTKVIKVDGGWTVQFTIGVQTFRLDITQPRRKQEAQGYKRQLEKAFEIKQ